MNLWAAWWLAICVGWAQEPDPDAVVPPPTSAPVEPVVTPDVAPPLDLDRALWAKRGPPGVDAVDAVAVSPDGRRAVLLVGSDGAVWLSEDAGLSWRRTLAPIGSALGDASSMEATLLNAETRLNELIGDLDLDELGVVDDAALADAVDEQGDALQQAAEAAVDELPSDALSGRWFSEVGGETVTTLAQAWWMAGARPVVARSDGTWVWDGASWSRVREPIHALAARPGGGWLAADADGLWATADLREWHEVGEVSAVRALAPHGNGVLAATDQGLFMVGETQRLEPWGDRRTRWTWVAADPWAPSKVWTADGHSVYRTDDEGATWVSPVGAPIDGALQPAVDGGGAIFVPAASGVWISRDGGGSYRRLVAGLNDATVLSVSAGQREVWIATSAGAFTLVAGESVGQPAAVDDTFPPVGLLLAAAEARVVQASQAKKGRSSIQILRWLTPQAVIEYRWKRGDMRDASLDAGFKLRADGYSTIHAWLEWRPPRQSTSGSFGGTEVIVQDTEAGPRIYAGGFDQWMMLGSVGRRITGDRLRVTNTITELASNRALLLRQRAQPNPDLLTKVHLELRIAEVDAWLDALTDGAVFRFRADKAQGEG